MRGSNHLGLWLGLVFLIGASGVGVHADTFHVLDDTDQVPAQQGTLRWAIERSEESPGPDEIRFLIDFAHIVLVAPLPELLDGNLTVNRGAESGPSAPPVYTISGELGVERALLIGSAGNSLNELTFVAFEGPEVILIQGEAAVDNSFSNCWFGNPGAGLGNLEAAVRIVPSPAGELLPTGTRLTASGFSDNGVGISIDGPLGPTAEPDRRPVAIIRRCWFGTDENGWPGPGNRRAVHVRGGRVVLAGSRLSGPGEGVWLQEAPHRSLIVRNTVQGDGPTPACPGFDGAAFTVEGSTEVVIDSNWIGCSEEGIRLGIGADRAKVNQNRVGRGVNAGLGDGIVLAGADGGTISRNRIQGTGGSGIRSVSGTGPSNLLTCNTITTVGSGKAIDLIAPQVQPPVLTGSGPLSVKGELATPEEGWVEMFTDPGNEANSFQGAVEYRSVTDVFTFILPAGLVIEKAGGGAALSFAGDDLQHSATWTSRSLRDTSELSAPLAVGELAPLFDLIRGGISHLAPLLSGGVDLGPLECLVRGATVDALITDPDLPLAGHGFFYLSRRRHPTQNVEPGSYNQPICLDLLEQSLGERIEGPGGCGP